MLFAPAVLYIAEVHDVRCFVRNALRGFWLCFQGDGRLALLIREHSGFIAALLAREHGSKGWLGFPGWRHRAVALLAGEHGRMLVGVFAREQGKNRDDGEFVLVCRRRDGDELVGDQLLPGIKVCG